MTPKSLKGRSAPKQVRSVLLNQIGMALEELQGQSILDSSVHSARKRIKQARATLRLMRYALPDATYRRSNLTLRDAARPLSATRDAKILIDALDKLVRKNRAIQTRVPESYRQVMFRARDRAQRAAVKNKTGIASSRRLLRSAKQSAARYPLTQADWSLLCQGLRRTNSRGRRLLAKVRADPSAEHLHEWRKDVKYLWHQLELLQPLQPGAVGKLASRAHKLSDYLGDDHDLAVLRDHVLANKAAFTDKSTPDALVAAIDQRRKALQTRALVLGQKIYDEKPSGLARRFDRYRHSLSK